MASLKSRTAELHLHYGDEDRLYKQGEAPQVREHGIPVRQLRETANAIIKSGVSFYANTQHNVLNENSWRLNEMVSAQLALEDTERRSATRSVTPILGAELSLRHEGETFHVGLLYEDWYREGNAPALPPRWSPLVPALEAARREANCVLVLNHPFTKASSYWCDEPKRRVSEQKAHELIGSGLFDGIEVLNGTGFFHNADGKVSNYLTTRAILAVEYWRKRGMKLSAIGGSDAHKLATVGQALTQVEAMNRREFCDALRAGEAEPFARHPNVVKGFSHAQENEMGLSTWDYLQGEKGVRRATKILKSA